MIRSPDDLTQPDFGNRVLRAWSVAQRIAATRAERQAEETISSLRAELEDRRRQEQRLATEITQLRGILGNVLSDPSATTVADLTGLNRILTTLEGQVQGTSKTVQLEVEGVPDFQILGRIARSDGAVVERREALLTFRVLDARGQALPHPSWVQASERYGGYCYIAPDALGWFERYVALPKGAAIVEIAAHDFRNAIYKDDPEKRAGHLIISDLLAVSNDLLSGEMLATTSPNDEIIFDQPGALALTPDGVETAITLPHPVTALHFNLSLGIRHVFGGAVTLETEARSGTPGEVVARSIALDGDQLNLRTVVSSDTPFSQAIVRLRPEDPASSPLVLERTIRRVGIYPDPGIFKKLNVEKISVNVLETMANDWDERGAWYSVNADITSYQAPLALVARLGADAEPQTFSFRYAGKPGTATDKRGMVVSVVYFDAEGRRIAVAPGSCGFSFSQAAGDYRYAVVDGRDCNFLSRLPMPKDSEGRAPAYMAVCVQGWGCREYTFLSALPMLAPSEKFSARFTELMLEPNADSKQLWNGIFVRRADGSLQTLTPAHLITPLDDTVGEIVIRFGGADAELSNWRDLTDMFWSPDASKLRHLVWEAREHGLPITLRLERLTRLEHLPRHLIGQATVVHATQDQADLIAPLLSARTRLVIAKYVEAQEQEFMPSEGLEEDPQAEGGVSISGVGAMPSKTIGTMSGNKKTQEL